MLRLFVLQKQQVYSIFLTKPLSFLFTGLLNNPDFLASYIQTPLHAS